MHAPYWDYDRIQCITWPQCYVSLSLWASASGDLCGLESSDGAFAHVLRTTGTWLFLLCVCIHIYQQKYRVYEIQYLDYKYNAKIILYRITYDSPSNKDHSILGSILEPPFFGNSHIGLGIKSARKASGRFCWATFHQLWATWGLVDYYVELLGFPGEGQTYQGLQGKKSYVDCASLGQ